MSLDPTREEIPMSVHLFKLSHALGRYRRERFLEGLNQDFLSSPIDSLEIEELEGTVADGLENY